MKKKLNSRTEAEKSLLEKKVSKSKKASRLRQTKAAGQTPSWQSTVSYFLAIFLVLVGVGVCAALLLKPGSSLGAITCAGGLLTIVCTKGIGHLFKSQGDSPTILSLLAPLIAKLLGAGK
jgi:preprotein translocase subunit SecF